MRLAPPALVQHPTSRGKMLLYSGGRRLRDTGMVNAEVWVSPRGDVIRS